MTRDTPTRGLATFDRSSLLALVVALVLHTVSAHGQTIYSGTTDGPWTSGESNYRLAQTFSTGNTTRTLNGVEVWVRNASVDDDFSFEGSLSVFLYGVDGANKPTGSSLLTIVDAAVVGEWGDVWVGNTNLSHSLAANTTYAVVFIPEAGSTISWKYNDGAAITSSISPTPTFFNWQSADDGGSWSDAPPTTGFNMIVTAPVPEPSSYCMALAGLACGCFSMWRRRKRA